MKDPAVDTMAMGLGVGVGNSSQNTGRMFITLKPREERDADVFQVIARLRPQLAKIPGSPGLPSGRAGRHRRRPLLEDPVPVHAAGRQPRRAQRLGAEDPRQAQVAAGAARRRHRPAELRHDADAQDRPRHGLALRHPAAAHRRHALRRVRPAAGHAVLHPGEHLRGGRGGAARRCGATRRRSTSSTSARRSRPDGAA